MAISDYLCCSQCGVKLVYAPHRDDDAGCYCVPCVSAAITAAQFAMRKRALDAAITAYGAAQSDGCDPEGAWRCAKEAIRALQPE